jgi:pyruvate-ferredoxin/flavodoxin oxidoreductase
MLGALQPARAAAPGRAAAHAYLDAPLDGIVDQAMQRFAELTGREHTSLSTHRIDDAKLILLAMGSAIETAEAAADRLRATDRLKVGVVGLRRLHPFPGAELARLLGRDRRVCVLDCADVPLSDDPPLLRQLRSALDRAADNQQQGAETHPGYPALASKDRPRLLSVIYGLGGHGVARERSAASVPRCRQADATAGLSRDRLRAGGERLSQAPGVAGSAAPGLSAGRRAGPGRQRR